MIYPGFNETAKPLRNLLAKYMPFHLSKKCLKAFKAKGSVDFCTYPAPPHQGRALWAYVWCFELFILRQYANKKSHAIYYVSHTFSDAQLNYTAIEKEFNSSVWFWKMSNLLDWISCDYPY